MIWFKRRLLRNLRSQRKIAEARVPRVVARVATNERGARGPRGARKVVVAGAKGAKVVVEEVVEGEGEEQWLSKREQATLVLNSHPVMLPG